MLRAWLTAGCSRGNFGTQFRPGTTSDSLYVGYYGNASTAILVFIDLTGDLVGVSWLGNEYKLRVLNHLDYDSGR